MGVNRKYELLRASGGLQISESVPRYMQQGSDGRAVTLVHIFLCGQGLGAEIIFDEKHGPATAKAIKEFQKRNGLEADGNWGPATRAVAKEKFNFDFGKACRLTKKVSPIANSTLIQPNGKRLLF